MNTATFNSLYNPNKSPMLSTQILTRFVRILILLGALAYLVFGFAESSFADEDCESSSCTFACSHATKQCSFFSPKNVAAGYRRVAYLPAGYSRISSRCNLPKCPAGSITCERWGRAKTKP